MPSRGLRCGKRFQWVLDYWRSTRPSWHRVAILDLCTVCADQMFVGGNQRHVGIYKYPTELGRYLHVKVQVIGSPVLAIIVVADLAQRVAFMDQLAAEDSVS